MRARERGAKVIHVDPRYGRTSACANLHVPIRSGTDIAFLGGIIRHVLETESYFKEYVLHYTNASTIITEKFADTEDLGGVFSGFDPDTGTYDRSTWMYEGGEVASAAGMREHATQAFSEQTGVGLLEGPIKRDETLQHERCVFQLLRKHYSRYTPEMVSQICGISERQFYEVANTLIENSGRERTTALVYAVGWTQQSLGVQMIRAGAILQLLLGNIGRPGGGILALRGHASIQGSTDIPTLYDILPGYLPMPFFEADSNKLQDYIKKHKARTGLWSSFDKYFVSLMKAYYGEKATKENNWGFDWLPRVTGDHSHFGYWIDMAEGKLEGLFVMGQNPAVGASNGRFERKALAKLKWLVVRDLVETETASFWYASPEVERGELSPETIGTEVFLFPAAGTAEKEGTFTNTQRLLQYREKAVEPPGDARSETWFVYHLGRRLKDKAKGDLRPRNEGLRALTWNYTVEGPTREPKTEEVLKEINGYFVADRTQLTKIKDLEADGSTACGAWIYCGVYPRENYNRALERNPNDFLGHGWGFAWPNDCRIIYNRASARPDGEAWSERKKLVWWDKEKREWTGNDHPDYDKSTPPDAPADTEKGEGVEALGGARPFTLHPDGVGWLYVASGLKDGPLPAHYEPLESLFQNPLYDQQTNPAADRKERPDNSYASSPGDPRFPYILSTYRLTEHHTAGGMSRYLSHLSELQPELFTEISPELASELGLRNGEWATIVTARALVQARILITPRLKPLQVDGRTVHQVGLPYHWGYKGMVQGDIANDLLVISEEPNVRIMETKALVCNVVPGRRARGPEALRELESYLGKTA